MSDTNTIRRQIAAGTYETPAKLEGAIDGLMNDLASRDSGQGREDCIQRRNRLDREGARMVDGDCDGMS